MSKARAFCLTINNYSEMDLITATSHLEDCSYGIIGKEKGEQGTPHLQIYYRYPNPRSFNAVKKHFPKAHIEIAKGTAQQNRDYCAKQGDYVEAGQLRAQGERTDLDEIKEMVRNGATMREVVQRATSYQSARMGQLLLQYRSTPSRKAPRVIWIYGPSGTGKTHRAIEMAGDDYWISGRDLRWFQGYCGQKTVVIDDFRADYCKFHEMLRLLDKYPYHIEVKNGSDWWVPDLIIITSCYSPQEVYKGKTSEDVVQLTRRIHEVIKLSEVYVPNS